MTAQGRPDTKGIPAGIPGIYDALRSDILHGTLPPGAPAREVALAERFGVSRTPVREALRRLEHDRLLVRSSRGLVVRAVDTAEVMAIYDVRILLEGEAAAQAADARGPADLLVLDSLLDRDLAMEDPDDATRTATNIEFHEAIWAATHNDVLVDLLDRLAVHLVRAPHSTLSAPGRWDEALDEHVQLFEAIRDRKADRARTVATTHMRTARELRVELLRQTATSRGS